MRGLLRSDTALPMELVLALLDRLRLLATRFSALALEPLVLSDLQQQSVDIVVNTREAVLHSVKVLGSFNFLCDVNLLWLRYKLQI
jgi:hypothetical protein